MIVQPKYASELAMTYEAGQREKLGGRYMQMQNDVYSDEFKIDALEVLRELDHPKVKPTKSHFQNMRDMYGTIGTHQHGETSGALKGWCDLTHRQLAQKLGVDRACIPVYAKALEKMGLIHTMRVHYTLDPKNERQVYCLRWTYEKGFTQRMFHEQARQQALSEVAKTTQVETQEAQAVGGTVLQMRFK